MESSPVTKHDFKDLRRHYPQVIAQMPAAFNSHQFILTLAQLDQPAYIAALQTYCDGEEPFKIVHQQLSALLNDYPELVTPNGRDENSHDIFGNRNSCRSWLKPAVA